MVLIQTFQFRNTGTPEQKNFCFYVYVELKENRLPVFLMLYYEYHKTEQAFLLCSALADHVFCFLFFSFVFSFFALCFSVRLFAFGSSLLWFFSLYYSLYYRLFCFFKLHIYKRGQAIE